VGERTVIGLDVSPEYALPATVAATHLTASAAELAKDAAVGDLADLTAVIDQLVAGQQHIATALAKLADHIADRHRDGALTAVDAPEITALTEVLAAAADATGHAAGALAQSGPVLDIVLAAAGPDARI
jgi:hypothetical protein